VAELSTSMASVGQVSPVYPDGNASRIKSCLVRDISRCAGTYQG